MQDRKFEIIQELMDELQGLMEPTADDFSERLGKPKVEVVSVEGEMGEPEMEEEIIEESPEEKLKNRIMKLRG